MQLSSPTSKSHMNGDNLQSSGCHERQKTQLVYKENQHLISLNNAQHELAEDQQLLCGIATSKDQLISKSQSPKSTSRQKRSDLPVPLHTSYSNNYLQRDNSLPNKSSNEIVTVSSKTSDTKQEGNVTSHSGSGYFATPPQLSNKSSIENVANVFSKSLIHHDERASPNQSDQEKILQAKRDASLEVRKKTANKLFVNFRITNFFIIKNWKGDSKYWIEN